jgi:hypothetical protein
VPWEYDPEARDPPSPPAEILWQAVLRPEGYPGDEGVKLSELLADRGALLQRKLTIAAGRCSDELVEFFQGAD